MNLQQLLKDKLANALQGLSNDPATHAGLIRPSDPKFGDYQANCAMPIAKTLGKKPRDVAAELVGRLDPGEILEKPEIAGPGFINLRFRNQWLAGTLQKLAGDERCGVPLVEKPSTLVIDYSSPNVAKPMHVGHLRSTIIGDALARLFRFLGHRVITDNHLGDWGTQFGILIYGYKNYRDEAALKADPVQEMVRLYILVRNLIKQAGGGEEEEEAVNPIAEACRQETAKLHAGDPENVRLWQTMMPWCIAELDRIYRRLDVHFDHTFGESFYNPMLPAVVAGLKAKGVAQESEGAVVVFLPQQPKSGEGKPLGEGPEWGKSQKFGESEKFGGEPPAIIQKRDGAFTYTTSDVATIRYRIEHFHPDVILYVVDARQALHFKNLFAIARRAGDVSPPVQNPPIQLEHISFGSVLGQDHRPIKTREGGAVELAQLLDEAVERARKIVDENSPELSEADRKQVAEVVGLGAVKYADLSQNRTSDYVFSFDKMLAMDGNTATYMQYAYARVKSVFRKGEENANHLRSQPPLPILDRPEERGLALAILRFPEALDAAAADYKPNIITNYLWDLANAYSGFYQNCPVLKAESPELRRSRLLLCHLTARTIQKGLDLLGIRTIEQM